MLVLAGAGTGKTRELTTRLAHILGTRRAYPGELLAVGDLPRQQGGAREMRERLESDDRPGRRGCEQFGTRCAAALARIACAATPGSGRPAKSSFTILDTDDQLRLVKQILAAANIDERRWPARVLHAVIEALEGPRPHP